MAIAVLSLTGTTGSNGTAVSSFTVTKPTGLADGAVMYLAIGTNNGTAVGGSQAKNTDSTWTRLKTGEDNATANVGLSVFRRVVTTAASEPASYAFSIVQNSDDTTAQTVSYGWCLIGYSGVDTTTPEDVTMPAMGVGGTGAMTETAPATSSVTDNAWAFACAVSDQTTTANWTAPASYTNLTTVTTGRACALATLGPITPAGPIAAASFTTLPDGAPYVAGQVSIRPIVVATGLPPGLGPVVGTTEPFMFDTAMTR